MRYFKLFDDISGPEGDIYRWDGKQLQMLNSINDWSEGYPESDAPAHFDQMVRSAMPWDRESRWEEIEVP